MRKSIFLAMFAVIVLGGVFGSGTKESSSTSQDVITYGPEQYLGSSSSGTITGATRSVKEKVWVAPYLVSSSGPYNSKTGHYLNEVWDGGYYKKETHTYRTDSSTFSYNYSRTVIKNGVPSGSQHRSSTQTRTFSYRDGKETKFTVSPFVDSGWK